MMHSYLVTLFKSTSMLFTLLTRTSIRSVTWLDGESILGGAIKVKIR